jgi:hypothetical protein
MHEVHGVFADHHKYIVPDQIDADVVAQQSRKQATAGEATYVHYHKFLAPCTNERHESYGHCKTAQVTQPTDV